MEKVMFDSMVFDKLPSIIDRIKDSVETQYEYYVTTTQIEELCAIPDKKIDTRIINILMLADLRPKLVPTSIFVIGMARLGYARLGAGVVYDKIRTSGGGNANDAIIADTAVNEGCVLVTEDKDLYRLMRENGYSVMHLSDFLNTLSETTPS